MTDFNKKTYLTRREFLKKGTAAALAPAIVPSSVFGQTAPSNLLTLGCIGVGRQGRGDMQSAIYRGLEVGARVVAVCDVDTHRREDAQWLVDKIYSAELGRNSYKSCDAYQDYRELLARKDIDGVLIVTPEHWHALQSIHAAEAGKDIYVEKPLTYSIAEGQELVKAVRKNKRILQVGSQQRSSVYFRMACEMTRNERIGKLHTIRVWLPQDQGEGDPTPMPVPKSLDYDFWMGPTAEVPYTEDGVHPLVGFGRPGWLQRERYCLGMITGWGSHMNDIAQWGNGSELSGPVEMEATAEFPQRGIFDVHTTFRAEGRYADGVRLVQETGDPAGVRFEGTRGYVFVRRGAIEPSDRAFLKEEPAEGEIKLYRSSNHMKNFLECMRSRKEPAAPVEVAHRSNSVCILTHIAMKLGRKLKWDPQGELFIGDDEANKWLDYPHRGPWAL